MRAVYVEPNKEAVIVNMDGELKTMQKYVGGYIKPIYTEEDAVLICNEEGKIMGLEPNLVLRDEDGAVWDIVCGPFLVMGDGEDDFIGLSDDQAQFYLEKFKSPSKRLK